MDLNQVHVDAVLTQLSIEFAQPGYVANRVFPFVQVKNESDKYYKFIKREELSSERARALRAPGAPAAEITWGAETDVYSCTEHAFKQLLPDRVRDNADAPIKPRARIARKITSKLWLGYEERVQELTQDLAVVPKALVTTKWDAVGGSAEKDIDAAKEAMKKNCGSKPTHILLSGPAARALRRQAKGKASALTVQDEVGFNELPSTIYGLRPIVAESIRNSANIGQDPAIADVWNDNVVLLIIDEDPGLETFAFGCTFVCQNFVMKTWRDEPRKGEFQEGSWITAEKRLVKECGFILEDALT